jgi:ribonuclease-3
MSVDRIEQQLGSAFRDPALLQQALTHRSHGNRHNERLEFLGDSVLNCVIAAELFERFPDLKEGELSRLRANLVRQEALHRIALTIGIGDHLLLGDGELKSGGHSRPSILADALEAVIGAIFVDAGFDHARSVVRRLYHAALSDVDTSSPGKDPKTLLQELMQSRHLPLPRYVVRSTEGLAHDQRFEVECSIDDLSVKTVGFGTSRRAAEQDAASLAFQQVRK